MLADIKPGATIEVQVAYLLSDESTVTVEVTDLFSSDDSVIATKKFSVE